MNQLRGKIKRSIHAVKNILLQKKRIKAIKDYKSTIWQTDKVATSFMKATDASNIIAASIMDEEVNSFFLQNCIPGSKVLDIGCGHGIVSIFLAKNGIKVTACDISEKLLDVLKQNSSGLDIDIRQGDAYHIPATENEFDTVVARMFLPNFADWPVVLKQMARVTKKGGKLLIHFTSRENSVIGNTLRRKECEFITSTNLSNPGSFFADTNNKELDNVCDKIGLRVIRRVPVTFFLHNRIIGHQLGTKEYNEYMEEVQKQFQEPKVKDFIVWFDTKVVSQFSPGLSYYNIIELEKL
jgi:ubiquinone/menaquinone biosynthesis C-methylase UbiE